MKGIVALSLLGVVVLGLASRARPRAERDREAGVGWTTRIARASAHGFVVVLAFSLTGLAGFVGLVTSLGASASKARWAFVGALVVLQALWFVPAFVRARRARDGERARWITGVLALSAGPALFWAIYEPAFDSAAWQADREPSAAHADWHEHGEMVPALLRDPRLLGRSEAEIDRWLGTEFDRPDPADPTCRAYRYRPALFDRCESVVVTFRGGRSTKPVYGFCE